MHETPGMTRDRKELVCEWNGKRFLLIDTGGVDIADPSPITKQIAQQARAAIKEADLVLFVVDARTGVTPGDEELAQILREREEARARAREQDRRPVAGDALALEFHRLGFGEPVPDLRAARLRTPATCSTRSSTLLPGEIVAAR